MIIAYVRSLILYLLLILVIRCMGKRQIGQMEPSEFVVTMLVADLASIPMQNSGIPLLTGVIPILTVLGLELVLSTCSMWSLRFRRFLCGKPVILIENGRILRENLQKTRVTLDELTGHLRQKDVLDLKSVQFAILETNGNLSVFPYPKEKPASAKDAGITPKPQYLPFTVVSDGQVLRDNLQKAGKSRNWLNRVLEERKTALSAVWMLTVDAADHIVLIQKED